MGKLITISGPRGCGKTHIIHELDKWGVPPIAPFTTRELRGNEVEGRDYRRVSDEYFEAARSRMFDVLDLGSKKYGTPRTELENVIETSGTIRTFNVAAQTAIALKEQFGEESVYATMLLPARWSDIRCQMREAGTPESQIEERIANEPTDLTLLPQFDEIILNRFGEAGQTLTSYQQIVEKLLTGEVAMYTPDSASNGLSI